jgi:hypothetical protein
MDILTSANISLCGRCGRPARYAVMVGRVEPCKLVCCSFRPSNLFVDRAASLDASSRDTTESLRIEESTGKPRWRLRRIS